MSKSIPPIVPMSSPDLTDADRQAVMAVLETPNLSIGPKIQEFEAAFCRLMGARHAMGVNSGTAGLHLCVRAASIGAGDLVLTTPFSFVASTNVLLFENATPVFVDVDPRTGNLDVQQVAAALHDLSAGGESARRRLPRKGAPDRGRLNGILGVDVFGQPADWDVLRRLATEYHLPLIEDSCEALGAQYKGRTAGMLGDYGVFGFYPNKQITTGEGGMIVTNDDAAAAQMRALRNQGRAPGDTWLSHTFLGYNYRMDELSAALGISQLQRLEELMHKRQQVADWYARDLKGIPGIEAPQYASSTTRASWFVYVIRVASGVDRQALAGRLAERGIPVRPYFLPIHLQPYMVERFGYQTGDFPVTEDLGARGLALPFSGVMTEEQVGLVCQALRASL
ncbi:predicted pyridoxal phosphate-dependent enzyme [Longilinea arvoryzae]|uniref:Predicted pyridoxal phosphate-dependent enzyme n=1 Tax=Longilinea arvoryzae TaxID=360412 RepID=A0A0S7BJ38_9CHLR|nr:DegT/DnrJ/EryC1/StrS family aminotransferase [Longilinea arvoryzae]GAP15641.1 predicted pyridoxal phosphate-dependent enzyme [Longilinea arvoryzae]